MSGNRIALTAGLLASTIGPMTPMERAAGRYMRAPDHGEEDGGYKDFADAGEVEVGSNVENEAGAGKGAAAGAGKGEGEPGKEAGAGKGEGEAAKEGEEAGEGEGEEGDEGEEDDEKPKKAPKKPSERIRELTARNREKDRLIEKLLGQLPESGKKGLQTQNSSDTSTSKEKPAPDPTDKDEKGNPLYPLGHLDDRYIEDKLEWLAEKKAGAQADAVLQRQQERERQAAAEQAQTKLLQQVDDLSTRGTELYDDFQEAVVDSGLRGDWRLDQPTFEAAHEATHGARILYELSKDKTEAARVASLSPFQQMKFVMDKDAEIAKTAKPRTKPGAGAPPETQTRGANSRTKPAGDTDDLDAFEKAWDADAKGR